MNRSRRLVILLALAAIPTLIPAAAEAAGGTSAASADLVIWEFIRASGVVAYLLLSIAVFMGVAVNARALDSLMRRAWAFEVHQTVSVLALVFTGLHVLFVLANQHVPFSLAAALVPMVSPWRPLATAMGIVSVYLVAALVISSYLRDLISQRAWRLIHYGGFAAWAMALAHGIAAGSDTTVAWMQYLYLASGAAVAFLIIFRILAPRRGASTPTAGRQASGHRTRTAATRNRASGSPS